MSTIKLTRGTIWVGILVTSLLTPLAFFVVYGLYDLVTGSGQAWQAWALSLGFTYLFGGPIAFLALAVLGWPWLIALTRWRRLTVAYVCAGAGAIGMVTFVVAAALLRGGWPFNLSMLLEQFCTGLLMGLISGAIFCAVVRIPMRSV